MATAGIGALSETTAGVCAGVRAFALITVVVARGVGLAADVATSGGSAGAVSEGTGAIDDIARIWSAEMGATEGASCATVLRCNELYLGCL